MCWKVVARAVFTATLLFIALAGCNQEPETSPSPISSPALAGTLPVTAMPAQAEQPMSTVSALTSTKDLVVAIGSIGGQLEGLESYRLRSEVSFSGLTAGGESSNWVSSADLFVASNPPGRSLSLSSTGSSPGSSMEMIHLVEREGQSYLNVPDIGCISNPGSDHDTSLPAILDPDSFVEGMTATQSSGNEEAIDGVMLPQYEFGLDNLGAPRYSLEEFDGTLLINEQGIPVRLSFQAAGVDDYLDRGLVEEGVLKYEMSISDINQPLEIAVPSGCLTTNLYPVIEGAYQITQVDELVSYQYDGVVSELVDFYLVTMPVEGWTIVGEPMIFDDTALLSFEREGLTIAVNLDGNPDENLSFVLISPEL